MVIPIGGLGVPLAGPPPPELWARFMVMKKCVLTMMACVCGQFVAMLMLGAQIGQVLFAPLNLIINTVIGIFMLRDDPQVASIYRFLATTCCQCCAEQCGGGMSCLVSFIACNLIMVIFDLLLNGAIQAIVKYIQVLTEPQQWRSETDGFAIALLIGSKVGALGAEIIGAYIGYKAYKEAQNAGITSSGGDWGSSGTTGGAYPLARDQSSEQARESRPAQNFQAFTGGGNRLGSA